MDCWRQSLHSRQVWRLLQIPHMAPLHLWSVNNPCQYHRERYSCTVIKSEQLYWLREIIDKLLSWASSEYFCWGTASSSPIVRTYFLSSTSYLAMVPPDSAGSLQLTTTLEAELTLTLRSRTAVGPVKEGRLMYSEQRDILHTLTWNIQGCVGCNVGTVVCNICLGHIDTAPTNVHTSLCRSKSAEY